MSNFEQSAQPKPSGASMLRKLTLAMFGACLLVAVSIGVLSDMMAREAAYELASNELATAANSGSKAVENFTNDMASTTQILAESPLGRAPLLEFGSSWNSLFGVDPSEDLRRAYITDNPHPAGKKHLLDKADDNSGYSIQHAHHHPPLRRLLESKGFYDIFLINVEGVVVYSVFKEDDFARNVKTGSLASSGLGKAFNQVITTNESAWSDIEPYAPSANAPALFFAAPIKNSEGKTVGVAAVQANKSRLVQAFRDAAGSNSDRATYLIGENGILRTDLQSTPENESLRLAWRDPAVGQAFAEGEILTETTGALGNRVVAVVRSFTMGGSPIAIVAEWDYDAFMAPVFDARLNLLMLTTSLLLLSAAMAFLLARGFSNPIKAMSESVRRIAEGETLDIPGVARGDELGGLARSLTHINDRALRDGQVRVALDRSPQAVMIADANFMITYVNDALKRILKENTDWLRQRDPDFDPDRLIGRSIHVFHTDPSMQTRMLERMTSPMESKIEMGERTLGLYIGPLTAPDGTITGYRTGWTDLTMQLQIEREIESVIDAVAAGDFSNRITVDSDQAFVANLIKGLNGTSEVISGFLGELQTTMAAMAGGDTTRRMSQDHQGAFLEVAEATNITMGRTGDLVGRIKSASEQIESAATGISTGATDLSARAENQASSLEETAATMEELAASVRSNTTNVDAVNKLATESSQAAETGQDVVTRAVTAMARIEDSSAKVSDIVTVIDSIAFQTNLLALNAAVEAARAGDAGKGFAVVASEVRTLAQRSADAARDIKQLIQESSGEVADGVTLVRSTGTALEEISAGIARVAQTAQQIAAAGHEQTTGIEEIAAAVSKLDEITQQNSALADKSASEASGLTTQVEALTQLTSAFKVDASLATQPTTLTPHAMPRSPDTRIAPSIPDPAADPIATSPPVARDEATLDSDLEEFAKSAHQPAPAVAPIPQKAVNGDDDWAEF